MANIPTLSRFGVPIDGTNSGILHPKQKYRFRVIWTGFGADATDTTVMTASVMTCTRPKITYDEVKLDSYNSVAWINGKHSFDPIEIKLRDDITTQVATTCGQQVQRQMNHFEQTSASTGNDYKFTMEIHSLDGTTNEEIEAWYLEGCWLTSVTYGEGDYSSGDVQEISLSVRFDNAVNIGGDNSVYGAGDPYPNDPSPTGGTTFA